MNTIIVTLETIGKKWAYNTDSKVAIGDVLVSPEYSNSEMTVIDVLDESYKYIDQSTGELSNKMTSLNQNIIRNLKVAADSTGSTVICIRLTK